MPSQITKMTGTLSIVFADRSQITSPFASVREHAIDKASYQIIRDSSSHEDHEFVEKCPRPFNRFPRIGKSIEVDELLDCLRAGDATRNDACVRFQQAFLQ